MNREETLLYIHNNFNINSDAFRLIDNILYYVELQGVDRDEQHAILRLLLDNTIGLSNEEIEKINLSKSL